MDHRLSEIIILPGILTANSGITGNNKSNLQTGQSRFPLGGIPVLAEIAALAMLEFRRHHSGRFHLPTAQANH